jgi:transcriptional regulator GlxA family with amidase domain
LALYPLEPLHRIDRQGQQFCHLLRQYAASKVQLIVYDSGLSKHQVLQVVEYINEHLNQDIKLADLAALLGISQSHFSRRFKQSIGITPINICSNSGLNEPSSH